MNFLDRVSKKSSDAKSYENPVSGSRVIHADRQTDMTTLIVASGNFANTLKKGNIAFHIPTNLVLIFLRYELFSLLMFEMHVVQGRCVFSILGLLVLTKLGMRA